LPSIRIITLFISFNSVTVLTIELTINSSCSLPNFWSLINSLEKSIYKILFLIFILFNFVFSGINFINLLFLGPSNNRLINFLYGLLTNSLASICLASGANSYFSGSRKYKVTIVCLNCSLLISSCGIISFSEYFILLLFNLLIINILLIIKLK